jgi:hypothetical protein
VLFTVPTGVNRNIAISAYDVSPDDSRFLMIRSPNAGMVGLVASSTGERVILVEHWIEELQARVPR